MITHDAEGIELEFKLFYRLLEGIEEHFPAFVADKLKLPVIAPNGHMVAVVGFEVAWLSRHLGRQLLISYQ